MYVLKKIANMSGRMWTKPSPPIVRAILEIIQGRLIVRAWVRARVRALCYYILSVVPDAGTGPCHWLLLVSYSGAMYFWSTPRALYFVLAWGKKKGWEKGGEVEFVTGDAKKAACHGYAKSGDYILRCLLQRRAPLSLAYHEIITCRTIISSYPRYAD